ncbi:cyclin-J18-like isoform X2 [Salvia miltiorrhiza]|uniref:cyclin-J18-like isoform X2 n=1 Tax=Salvia miltiorrhiza TaxID=226208 RepID=UPI0025ACEFC1|nr:cyclin-J18-like isoform X2 [Salvia miltiorrhiza]XP_057785189.1 cyclin-J18-like isoform X2 [Salvia miltiorrhiza]
MKKLRCPCLRSRLIEFLIRSAQFLEVSPIVKYSALSLFADRFYPALSGLEDSKVMKNWLLHPIGECNLQLFALVSLWISSKIHDSPPLSVKNFKSLGDKFIKEQHFTMGDILEAVLQFGIGTSKIAFASVEELLVQFKAVAQVGEHVKFEACMDVMDLLYENEETSVLYSSPEALAASVVVVGYIITVPPQKWEFPVLPWVKFVTSCKEEDVVNTVRVILEHIFQPQAGYYVTNG